MERKLASIRVISDLQPIPERDFIELAKVDGWSVIVKKGEFQVGDFCIYFEIDSVLPDLPPFEFLGGKLRIKTMKMRGIYSQGICFPLLILKDILEPEFSYDERNQVINQYDDYGYKIVKGLDLTEMIGVTKYEPPVSLTMGGEVLGPFPSEVIKTDAERIQNLVDHLPKWEGIEFVASQKLDGTSSTFILKDGEFKVCSKNLDLKEDDKNLYWQIAKKYDLENKMRKIPELYDNKFNNFAIQGEIVGPGIQKNILKRKEIELFLFANAWSIDEQRYLTWNETYTLYSNLGMLDNIVPIVFESAYITDLDDMLRMAEMKSLLGDESDIEGLVWTTKFLYDNQFKRICFKVINNRYLMKHE